MVFVRRKAELMLGDAEDAVQGLYWPAVFQGSAVGWQRQKTNIEWLAVSAGKNAKDSNVM
jgi:hypothetical protein